MRRKLTWAGGNILDYADITGNALAPAAITDGQALVSNPGDQLGRRDGAPHHLEIRFDFEDADQTADVAVWYYFPEDDGGKWYKDCTLLVSGGQQVTRMAACRRNPTRVYLQVVSMGTGDLHAAIDAINSIQHPDRDTDVDPQVKPQDDAPTPGGLVQAVQHVSLEGHILRSGFYEGDALYTKIADAGGGTDDVANVKQNNADGAADGKSLSVQHIDKAGATLPAMDVNTRAGFVQLTNGTNDATLKAASADGNTGHIVQATQHQDKTGNVTPAGDVVTRSIYTAVGDGANTAGVKQVDAAGSASHKALIVQEQDEGGNIPPAGDANTRAKWTRLTSATGDKDALIRAGNAAAAVDDNVLLVQAQDKTGEVMAAGDSITNAPFFKPTDGTLSVAYKEAQTAAAIDTIVQPVQHIGEDGSVAPAGTDVDPIKVERPEETTALPISRQNTGANIGEPGAIIADAADLATPTDWTGATQGGHVFSLLQRGDGAKQEDSSGALGTRKAPCDEIDMDVDIVNAISNIEVQVWLEFYEPDTGRVRASRPIAYSRDLTEDFGHCSVLAVPKWAEFAAVRTNGADADTTVTVYVSPRDKLEG